MGKSANDVFRNIGTAGIESAVNKFKPKEPEQIKPREQIDEESEIARKRERDRIRKGAGANATRRSGSVADALGGSIGKTTLGGVT